MTVIILTVLAAPVIGLVLYWFSQRSARVKFQGRGPDAADDGAGSAADPRSLMPTILAHLNQLPAPLQQREHVARTVSDLMAKSLESQVTRVQHELKTQYTTLIEEQRRTEVVLQRKYQEALQEKKQTTSVLESIAEGLVVINNKGEVIMMNPAAERLLTVNQQERLGKPLLDCVQDEQLISLVRSGPQQDREIVLTAKQDSTKRVLRASNAVVNDEDGKTVGMVTVLSDVTKQRELDQLKSEFVSKVGHELRTPLLAIQHALAILVDEVAGPLSAEQQKFAVLAKQNLQRLSAIINDLLDLSKLEAQRMELRVEPCSLGAVIHTTCDSFEAWAISKAMTITRRVPDSLPQVTCDQARIIQVLTNLIGNAMKFTPKQGRITVEAKPLPEAQGVEVSVMDTGVGIAKDDLPKLFSKFQQVGERSASDISGTGLGLAIAKEIVELHHGRIWAESDGVHGARFAFILPLIPPASPPA